MTSKLIPSICLQCLASYTEGKLHYKWIELEDVSFDPDLLQEELEELLSESPAMMAEEWMIADYEQFGGLSIGEYESFERICELAQLIDEHGIAFSLYADNVGIDYANESDFMDSYMGCWESPEAYAWEYLDSTGALVDDSLLSNYFDIEAYVRDLEHELSFIREDRVGIHVFSS